MLNYIVVNYYFGIAIDRFSLERKRKLILRYAITTNLLLLVFFKYANFVVSNINSILDIFNIKNIYLSHIHLPLGISFITFHSISYLVDIYRKKAIAQKDPIKFALYISLFPQLIAGPIIRYHDIARQLSERFVGSEDFVIGIKRFIMGLGKKMIIANTVGAVADQIFSIQIHYLTCSVSWLGIICYTLQIYFDFSGYSDMAIGLCRMFGFHILENFNYPYISLSIREFWQRWHISLSNWFRDYLYIPLGGNRCFWKRNYFNLITVFFLCGLWHGASWSFVVWGLYHGIFLVIERTKFAEWLKRIPVFLQHVYALLVVMIGWVFFRADTLGYATSYLAAMFGFGQGTGLEYHLNMYLNSLVGIAMALGVLGAMPVAIALKNLCFRYKIFQKGIIFDGQIIEFVSLTVVFFVCILQVAIGTYNPFIYFRF